MTTKKVHARPLKQARKKLSTGRGSSLRFTVAPPGLADLRDIRDEMDTYIDTLLGRIDPPFDQGVFTLQEYASAAYGRAKEVEALIHRAENNGRITKGSKWYKFRTGELRAMTDIFRDAVDLGSRRLTYEQIRHDEIGSD